MPICEDKWQVLEQAKNNPLPVDNETKNQIDVSKIGIDSLSKLAWKFLFEKDKLIPTPFPGLNELIEGFRPSALYAIAGRPGSGKTSFALQLLLHCLVKKRKAIYFSLEMPFEEIIYRCVSLMKGIPGWKLRRGRGGKLGQAEKVGWKAAFDKLGTFPGFIADEIFRLDDIIEHIKVVVPEIVFVDFLTMIPSEDGAKDYRQHVGACCRAFKGVAKELGIPIIALSQLNRIDSKKTLGSGDVIKQVCRPTLMSLAEADSIGHMADVVLAINRPYAIFREEAERAVLRDWCEVEVLKNRHGPTGSVEMRFCGEAMKFEEHKSSDFLNQNFTGDDNEL